MPTDTLITQVKPIPFASLPFSEQLSIASKKDDPQYLYSVCSDRGWKLHSLKRRIREFLEDDRLKEKVAEDIHITEGHNIHYTDFPVVDGDRVIWSDIEMPDHFGLMLRLIVLTGIALGIDKSIIAGDLIATDQQAFNHWPALWNRKGHRHTFDEVIDESAIPNLREMRKWFKQIDMIEGNHDFRLAKATKGELNLGRILGGVVTYSRYEYMYLETPRGFVKITHPRNFSQDPITLAQFLYTQERGPRFDVLNPFNTLQKTHMVVGHCHRQQEAKSPDGVYEMHSLGAIRHPLKTQYTQKGNAKFKQWDNGFLVVKNGFFKPMKLNGTDWFTVLGGNDGLYPQVKDELEYILYPKKGAGA